MIAGKDRMIGIDCCINNKPPVRNEYLSVQFKAFGLRQFSNQQTMNMKPSKSPRRATGGHLVNRSLWMILSPCSRHVSIWKTEMYLPERKRPTEINIQTVVSVVSKAPSLYVISRIIHYASGGSMNVICQDFQTEFLFVYDRWGWEHPRLPSPPPTTIIQPHSWAPCAVRMHNTHRVQKKGTVCCRGNSAAKNSLNHSPRSESIWKWCENVSFLRNLFLRR